MKYLVVATQCKLGGEQRVRVEFEVEADSASEAIASVVTEEADKHLVTSISSVQLLDEAELSV